MILLGVGFFGTCSGGGGASTLVAALAVSLGTMVANLTTGKKNMPSIKKI